MLLLLLQMLLISCLGRREQAEEPQKKMEETIPHLSSQDLLVEDATDNKDALELGLFGANPLAEVMSKRQDESQRPNFAFPYSGATRDAGSWTPTHEAPHSQGIRSPSFHPHSKREAESTFRKDAKRFWDLFMLKTKSRSEEVVLPIKTNEMYEETCSTLPFSQVKEIQPQNISLVKPSVKQSGMFVNFCCYS